MPQWWGSARKSQLPPDWSRRRESQLRHDHYRCQWIREDTGRKCGDYANQVDHKDQTRNWDHSPANLQSLCEYHHGIKSSAEGGRAAAARKAATKRCHPGLLP